MVRPDEIRRGDNTVEAELVDGSDCTALPHHTERMSVCDVCIFNCVWVGYGVKESR